MAVPRRAFPDQLAAVIQQTVLSGESPARLVIHSAENDWLMGDGVTDPNEPGACLAAHIHHALSQNSSLTSLADLAPGWQAERTDPGHPWIRTPHTWEE